MRALYGRVDDEGNLRIPTEIARAIGLEPGAHVKLSTLRDGLVVHRPIMQLARVYVEPTTACNLHCRTCMRSIWNEPIGYMEWHTFGRILEGIRGLDQRPTLFFGGLGEPLIHPEFVRMVGEAKRLNVQVEAITNGMLLDEARTAALLDAGLGTLWVSIDGASPECYADVRREGEWRRVMENLERLRDLKIEKRSEAPEIGVSFVAMQRNLAELPELLRL